MPEENNEIKSDEEVDEGEYQFADTLNPANIKKEFEAEIKEVKTIKTRYGDKRTAVIEAEGFEGKKIFLNAISLGNIVEGMKEDDKVIVEGYGKKIKDWIGKKILLKVETSERTRGKASIVCEPIK